MGEIERICRLQNKRSSGEKDLQMGRKHVGKGEIARYEHFLLSPQCFQKTCTADT